MVQLNEAVEKFKAQDTEVIMLISDNREKTGELMKKLEIDPKMHIALDPDFEVIKQYLLFKENKIKGEAIPATFIVDKEGKLRFKYMPSHYSDRPPIEHIFEVLLMIN